MPSEADVKIVALLLITVIFRATSNMVQTSVPLFASYVLHGSNFLVSIIAAVSTVSGFLAYSYAGFKVRNLKRAASFGLIFLLGSLCLLIFLSNFVTLALVASTLSIAIGGLSVTLLTLSALGSDASHRERNVKLFTAALSLGLLFGPLWQALMLFLTGSNLVYSMILFAPLVLVAFLFLPWIKESTNSRQTRIGLDLGFVRNPLFISGVLADLSFTVPLTIILTFGGIYAKDNFGASFLGIQLLFSVFFFTSFLARMVYVRVSPGKSGALISSIIVTIAGLLIMYFASNFSEILLAGIILGYAHGIYFPVSINYIADGVPSQRLASALSVMSIAGDSTSAVALPLVGDRRP